MTQIHHISL
jgi:hypothetical protein